MKREESLGWDAEQDTTDTTLPKVLPSLIQLPLWIVMAPPVSWQSGQLTPTSSIHVIVYFPLTAYIQLHQSPHSILFKYLLNQISLPRGKIKNSPSSFSSKCNGHQLQKNPNY